MQQCNFLLSPWLRKLFKLLLLGNVMVTHKNSRQKGKFSFAKYFQQFKAGEKVAVVEELSFPLGYSKRLQGRTGKVISKRGSAYYVEISDLNKPKKYLIKPIHLKRIESK